MKFDERDPLLNDLLAGEEISDFREASLARALDALKRRKRRAGLIRFGALALLPVSLLLLLLLGRMPHSSPTAVDPHSVAGGSPPARVEEISVRPITDEELLALFPDRSLALIGPPGRQELVFLGSGSRADSNGHL